MWKNVRKLWPKCGNTLPTAKKDYKGKLVSCPRGLKALLAKEYKERLRRRPTRPDLIRINLAKELIFQLEIELASSRNSDPWTLNELEAALKDLKRNKSRDSEGYVNEIFKKEVIGDNLKMLMLTMFNKLKKTKTIPKFMNMANITTVPKKGSRLKLENERGIFRVSVIRNILMRLIYNSKYNLIDQNISDCQMGERKSKSLEVS